VARQQNIETLRTVTDVYKTQNWGGPEMRRRHFFSLFSLAGASLAAAGSLQAQGTPATAGTGKSEIQDPGPWSDWPWEEVRIPYRERKARVKWPNNSPLWVYMYITGEWGRLFLNDPKGLYKRDLRGESEGGQYELEVAIYRAINLLDKHGLKVSVAPYAGTVEHYPDLFRELVKRGHEIQARPYSGISTTRMTPTEERAEIKKITAVIEKVTGKRPMGFDNPGGVCTDQTPHILAEEGYLYMCGLKGDDLPYGIKTRSGKTLLVIGSRHTTTNDNAIFEGRGMRSPSMAFEYMKDIFDCYYKLGVQEFPGTLNYGIHPKNGLLPERVIYQDRILGYMTSQKDVRFTNYLELAEYWQKTYINA